MSISDKNRDRGFGNHNMEIIEPPCDAVSSLRPGVGPFRPNVAGLVLRSASAGCEILLGERYDTPGAWQWPQGGVDKGEAAEDALFRELREEIGVERPRIVHRFPFLLRYRFPESLANRFKRWVGQEQVYFLLTLEADDPPSLAKATEKEFRQLQWFPLAAALHSAVWFKEPVYRTALSHAEKVLPKLNL